MTVSKLYRLLILCMIFIGGMLESYGSPGELFTVVILEQFKRIRDADRFWFENEDNG